MGRVNPLTSIRHAFQKLHLAYEVVQVGERKQEALDLIEQAEKEIAKAKKAILSGM